MGSRTVNPSRFVVGIDLGTTNSALAYVDTGAGTDAKVTPFPVPQVVGQGAVEDRTLLPSFLYLPGPGEQPAGALKLPWDANRDYAVGELDRAGDGWRQQVGVGDLVLVADVGGGTSDFTLIEVGEEGGNLELTRLAVGDHLLLGGDNMDLTLAYYVSQALAKNGTKLDAGQMVQLTYACRNAKEQILADPKMGSAP